MVRDSSELVDRFGSLSARERYYRAIAWIRDSWWEEWCNMWFGAAYVPCKRPAIRWPRD